MVARPFDLELLQSFATVAESGSVTAASRALFRSQSAVSEQLQKLETYCGLALLERGRAGVSLTAAGERLLEHARGLLARSQAAYEDMRGIDVAGELRLAITDYFRPGAIALVLKELRDQYPRLRTRVAIVKSAVIERDAGVGAFDLGISMTLRGERHPQGPGTHRRIRLRSEPLTWIAAADLALAPGEPVPLVALPDSCSLQARVLRELGRSKTPYYLAHTASGVGGVQSAVMAGLGVACLNQSAAPEGARAIRSRARPLPALPEAEFSLLVAADGPLGNAAFLAERLATRFG